MTPCTACLFPSDDHHYTICIVYDTHDYFALVYRTYIHDTITQAGKVQGLHSRLYII